MVAGRLPRARGDGPYRSTSTRFRRRASPRSRGWTPKRGSTPRARGASLGGAPAGSGRGIDPARAWGFRRNGRWRSRISNRPRARVGLPRTARPPTGRVRSTPRARGASPRSRGWTPTSTCSVAPATGFPALAGMDPMRERRAGAGRGLPRARGDGPATSVMSGRSHLASPRSRGWTSPTAARIAARAGFPALAGMDPPGARGPRGRSGLPRARGDGPVSRRPVGGSKWASPRSRGWTLHVVHRDVGDLGFPALAGMDPARRGFPRA